MYTTTTIIKIELNNETKQIIKKTNELVNELGYQLDFNLRKDDQAELIEEDRELLTSLRDNLNFILRDLNLGD